MATGLQEMLRSDSPNSATRRPKKDKLAETKRAQREAKELRKAQEQAEKQRKDEAKRGEASAYKAVRHLNGDSKRCAREIREEAKREKHKATGQMCEHGVWRCTICFPHSTKK